MFNTIKSFFSLLALTKADLLIIVLILISAVISLAFSFNKGRSETILIRYNQEIIAHEKLNNDKIIEISSVAIVEIKDNKARMSYSSCKNQHCVHQSWSSKEPIICVPNKIIIEFMTDKKKKKSEVFITR